MNMLRLCTNQACRLFNEATTKEAWDEHKGTCPGCGRRSCNLISEEDWNKKKEQSNHETDKAIPSRIKPVFQERRPRPRIKFGQIGAVFLILAVAVILGSIIYAVGSHKAKIAAQETLAAAMTQVALANPTATATPVPTDIPATATPVPMDAPTTDASIVSTASTPTINWSKLISQLGGQKAADAIVSTSDWLVIILSLIMIYCGFAERINAGQKKQAWLAVILATVVLIGSSQTLKVMVEATGVQNIWFWVSLIVSLLCTAVICAVCVFDKDGYDGSAIALYFSIITIGGGAFLSNLGFAQGVFKIQEGTLLSLGQMFDYISHGQAELAKFSVIVYSGLLLTLLIYGYEVIKPSETREFHPSGILLFIVGVGSFAALRLWGYLLPGGWGIVFGTVIGDMFAWFAINVFVASLFFRQSPHAENWHTLPIQVFKKRLLTLVSPLDGFAMQALGIISILMATGAVQAILHSLSSHVS